MDERTPDLATISNLLIVAGSVALAVAVAGIVGLLWSVAGGLFVGLLAAGVEAVVAGVVVGRVAAVDGLTTLRLVDDDVDSGELSA